MTLFQRWIDNLPTVLVEGARLELRPRIRVSRLRIKRSRRRCASYRNRSTHQITFVCRHFGPLDEAIGMYPGGTPLEELNETGILDVPLP
jgi:hypothetical protein